MAFPVEVSFVNTCSLVAEDTAVSALIAVCAVVCPVPPFAIGRVPVTPLDNGRPVQFVNVPEVGVPSNGVTKVGEVANTKEPDPVSSVIADARFALVSLIP